ncbi:diadenylate cyclase [Clostridium beijerinckii]|uniref:diadenylate cyclase n=1 Tax=Clostridium beijerinckii TaxID=1520 RepID=UPI00047BCF7A|nr:diadenylate cyclase [Clostridium beijerinckii]
MESVNDLRLALDQLSSYITEFVGIGYNVKINSKNVNSSTSRLEFVPENEQSIIKYVDKHYEKALEIIDSTIKDYLKKNELNFDDISHIFNKIAVSIIFRDIAIDSDGKKIRKQHFIKTLQDMSNLTYENENIKMGIFYCKNGKAIDFFKDNNNFEYIKTKTCDLKEFICTQKPLLKIIDNRNYAVVLNSDFDVIGVIKINFGCNKICDIMSNIRQLKEKSLFLSDLIDEMVLGTENLYSEAFFQYILNQNFCNQKHIGINKKEYLEFVNNRKEKAKHPFEEMGRFVIDILKEEKERINKELEEYSGKIDDILYITIENREIEFGINDYFSICQKSCDWKIKNYVSLAHHIFSGIYLNPNFLVYDKFQDIIRDVFKNCEFNSYNKEKVKNIMSKEIKNIHVISEKIFKLICNVKKMSISNTGALFVIITDEKYYKENKNKLFESSISINTYKNFIKSNNMNPCITEVNDDTLQLIASVDGATLLDKDFNIISYSEMIKQHKNFDKSKCGKMYGARTNAAVNGAYFAITIKVSEDGDITLFRKVKYRGNKDRVEKLLTI